MNMHTQTPTTPAVPTRTRLSPSLIMSAGADLLKLVSDNGRAIGRNPHHLKSLSVTLDTNGKPARYFDLNQSINVGYDAASSYNLFFRREVYPLVDRLVGHIAQVPAAELPAALSNLVRNGQRDPVLFWALSHDRIRRHIFPAAYDRFGRRFDDVFYVPARNPDAGRVIELVDLEPATVAAFVTEVRHRVARCPADLSPFQPITTASN